MPCRDWMDEDTSAAEERIKNLKSDMAKIRNKLNTLTRLLCEAGNIINETNGREKMSPELKNWFWEHKKEDRKNG